MSKIKAIYVVGDSFSFGQELGGSDVDPKDFYTCTDYMKENSYTGIIAKTWGVTNIINQSLPGGSNDRIFRLITTDLPTYLNKFSSEEIFVFISLTHASRREFYQSDFNKWSTLITNYRPDASNNSYYELWKIYSTYFDDAREYTPRFLSQVISMQLFLKNLGIKYLMSDSMNHDEKFWKEYNNMDKNVLNMIDNDRYYRDEPFNVYAGKQGLKFGKYNHPLEEGHIAWANHLLDWIHQKELY